LNAASCGRAIKMAINLKKLNSVELHHFHNAVHGLVLSSLIKNIYNQPASTTNNQHVEKANSIRTKRRYHHEERPSCSFDETASRYDEAASSFDEAASSYGEEASSSSENDGRNE
jgi:hypothetical protein